jgi:hypothetical protein
MRNTLLALAIAGACTVIHAQPQLERVRMIPADGEAAKYWPRWRGPSGQGHVSGTNYTDTWSTKEHIKWRAQVPGEGHSSPIVWGDSIFLTTSTDDGAKVSMLAFRRSDGTRPLADRRAIVRRRTRVLEEHARVASATTDGERIYASFGTHGLAAFDFSGKIVWHRQLGELSNYHGSAGRRFSTRTGFSCFRITTDRPR